MSEITDYLLDERTKELAQLSAEFHAWRRATKDIIDRWVHPEMIGQANAEISQEAIDRRVSRLYKVFATL